MRYVGLAVFLCVSACVAPQPAPVPSSSLPRRAAPPRAPSLAPSSMVTKVAPGVWRYQQDPRGSIALYGVVGSDAIFTLRCDLARGRVFASVPGTVDTGLTLHASTSVKSFAAVLAGGSSGYLAVEFDVADPFLDALAFSRGRIGVDHGSVRIALPAWPEFTRVIEDCRR